MRKLLLILSFALLAHNVDATTNYYVDPGRTTNGTGTAANPWKLIANINWTTIGTTLASDDVVVYFSSRGTEDDTTNMMPAVSGSVTHPLVLDGMSQYNLTASGTASWQAETVVANPICSTNCWTYGSATNPTTGIYTNQNQSYLTIKGFHLDHPKYGIFIGDGSGGHFMHDIHDVTLTYNYIDTLDPTGSGHGIYCGGCTVNIYNIHISHNTILRSRVEAIYLGQYDWYTGSGGGDEAACPHNFGGSLGTQACASTMTGTIVEYNTLIDCGQSGEGDIDIKAINVGAIIRYNSHYGGNASGGVVVFGTGAYVYGNDFHSIGNLSGAVDGYGIYFSSGGDALTTGSAITSGFVFNNLIYSNANAGISIYNYGRTVQGDLSGIKILNNTIVTDSAECIRLSRLSGVFTIAEIYNNICSTNTTYELTSNAGVTITASDYNLYYHPASSTFMTYQGTDKTFATWQALGYDTHGLNTNPNLDGSYLLQAGGAAIQAGKNLTSEGITDLNVDRVLIARPSNATLWDIGSTQYSAFVPPPVPNSPNGAIILGQR